MIDEKQKQLFHALKGIKDEYVITSLSKLENGIETVDLEEHQNEIIESVLYSVMELIDGYNDDLGFAVDLIEKDTGQSLKGNIELHDKFMDYLNEVENN
ncbi:hypothetical protein [Litchfieldia salsa]|uniref:Uncharacterized protein n=1 Tax=Litchfieldia salsa TaxID=930152 RepID=A0A1H0X0N7_9BACI|nr:hypothetical protein [Litchfieldia salsa]SDP96430.1 hypothetical protein SAMN05216565_12145 [Litchfieldia salsa]